MDLIARRSSYRGIYPGQDEYSLEKIKNQGMILPLERNLVATN
jgi:hypothetical protein